MREQLRVKVKRHEEIDGHPTFTVSLPLKCGECGYHFTSQVQVGVNDPIIPCPFCYSCNLLKLSWHLRKNKLSDGDTVEVIIQG